VGELNMVLVILGQASIEKVFIGLRDDALIGRMLYSFRATGITEHLRNGKKLEIAQQMANHESARTTGLYDRRSDQVNLDEVERMLI